MSMVTMIEECPRWFTKPGGVTARVCQQFLAYTHAMWHSETTNRLGAARSFTAYDR